MGYSITIGEATLEPLENDNDELILKYHVNSRKDDNSPAFGEPTDHTNERWPSYTTWSDTMKEAGLYEMFFDEEDGIMRRHPGCFRIRFSHLERVRYAIASRKEKTGNAPAGFWGYDEKTHQDIDNGNDSVLARLIWLEYWMDWALNNATIPAIENS